jgi:outer membrane protein TolC
MKNIPGWSAVLFLALLFFGNASLMSSARAQSEPAVVTVFESLKQKALTLSPQLRTAEANLQSREAHVHTSWAHWLPRVDLQLSQNRSQDYTLINTGMLPQNLGGFTPPELSLAGWTAKATFPIYRRSSHLEIEQAIRDRRLADLELNVERSEFDWQLRQRFGSYLYQAYREAAVSSSIELATVNQKGARIRYELGQRTKVDVLRAEANLLSLQSRVLKIRQEKEAARSDLLNFAGITRADFEGEFGSQLNRESELTGTIEHFSAIDHVLPRISEVIGDKNETVGLDEGLKRKLGERLASNSPAYRRRILEEESSRTKAALLMVQEWPELVLQGSLSKQNPQWDQLFNGRNQSFSVGLVLNIPLFIGGSLISTRSEQVAAQTAAQIKREQDLAQLRSDVESEVLQIRTLLKSVESMKASLLQNEEIVRLSTKSYELGKETMVELLTSQNELIDAKTNYAQARLDLSVLTRRLASHLGITL